MVFSVFSSLLADFRWFRLVFTYFWWFANSVPLVSVVLSDVFWWFLLVSCGSRWFRQLACCIQVVSVGLRWVLSICLLVYRSLVSVVFAGSPDIFRWFWLVSSWFKLVAAILLPAFRCFPLVTVSFRLYAQWLSMVSAGFCWFPLVSAQLLTGLQWFLFISVDLLTIFHLFPTVFSLVSVCFHRFPLVSVVCRLFRKFPLVFDIYV